MMDPYKNYKNISISTMTKGEQLVLLFDKALQRLTLAKLMIEQDKFSEADASMERTLDIFNYLMVNLDKDFAISKELMEIYAFVNGEIIKAMAKHETKLIDDILPIVRELRDTWEEADKITRVNK